MAKFKIMYNSDTTHIVGCISPFYRKKGDPLTPEMLDASVEEAARAGADCYAFAPGVAWVPWWFSEEFPVEKHVDWYFNQFGGRAKDDPLIREPFFTYCFNPDGKGWRNHRDIIREQLDSCKKYGLAGFVSIRMNDAHHIRQITPEDALLSTASPIYIEHPEYRIDSSGLPDYRFAEYRNFRLRMILEIIRNYQLDGIELDFMRWFNIFNSVKTTAEERLNIMTEFLGEIRKVMDEAEKADGKHRQLSVRIPAWDTLYGRMGIDVARWAAAGVSIFNLSASYYTDMQPQIAEVKSRAGEAQVFFELCHASAQAQRDAPAPGYPSRVVLRKTTTEQLHTAALNAYKQGADGISLFNFQYYRGVPESPFDTECIEPPFDSVAALGNPELLAEAPRHYFWGKTWSQSYRPHWPLPKTAEKGGRVILEMITYAPEGGWKQDGIFRIESESNIGDSKFSVALNGEYLSSTEDTGEEPYPNPYAQLRGTPERRRCFRVPRNILLNGENNIIEIYLKSGEPVTISYADLAI